MSNSKAGTTSPFDTEHLVFVGGHWLAGLGWHYEQGVGWRKPDGPLAGGSGDHGQALIEALTAEGVRLLRGSPPPGKEGEMDIYEKARAALKNTLTREELIALGERMDGDSHNGLLDLLNEHLVEVAPEVFADPNGEQKLV